MNFEFEWCDDPGPLGLTGWDKSAVGSGQANTTNMITDPNICSEGAAVSADSYTAPNGTADWFLPSIGEAMLMYTNLRQAGVGGFATDDDYWSSSEVDAVGDASEAWGQDFSIGDQDDNDKDDAYYVRPVRSF